MSSIDLSSFQCIEMAVFDTATLTGSFAPLNDASSYAIFTGDGFQDNIKVLKIFNEGTKDIIVSYDGETQHDIYPSGATLILDLQANHQDFSSYGSGVLNGRKGQIIYGKGTAGTGNLYIVGYR